MQRNDTLGNSSFSVLYSARANIQINYEKTEGDITWSVHASLACLVWLLRITYSLKATFKQSFMLFCSHSTDSNTQD